MRSPAPLTQGIYAIAERQQGPVDVRALHHPLARVVRVRRPLRPRQVNHVQLAQPHLLRLLRPRTPPLLDVHLEHKQ